MLSSDRSAKKRSATASRKSGASPSNALRNAGSPGAGRLAVRPLGRRELFQTLRQPAPRLAPPALVASRVEDEAVEPGEEALLAGQVRPEHLDEHLLHGVVHLVAESLEEEDAAHLRRVAAKELRARLGLRPAHPVNKTDRQLVDFLPPGRGTPGPRRGFAATAEV